MVETKIIATIGPSSNNKTVLRKMMIAGMDVVRLNFSHGTHQDLFNCVSLIRGINKRYRRHIKTLGDLEGHRIRIGRLRDDKPIELKKHKTLWLTKENFLGCGDIVPFDYHGPLNGIKIGQHIYIDDGNIALKVTGRKPSRLKTKVLIGGILKSRKGVNVPDARLQFGKLSEKDKADIEFCVRNGIDYIAQSFVRTRNDILQIRDLLKRNGGDSRIIAKIENRDGIKNIDEIIDVADGIMIARGDMGISVPIYEIPIIQKEIIKKCNRKQKPVITATQMLESMTENPLPTRAEVTDIANAVIDGSDYLMLSAETAVGRYPAEAVQMMNRIIKFTETHLYREETIPR